MTDPTGDPAAEWAVLALLARPAEHTLAEAARLLPEARLGTSPGFAFRAAEVRSATRECIIAGVLELAGPATPLPGPWAAEIARLDPGCAAAGLLAAIGERQLGLLAEGLLRRACDDPAAHAVALAALAALAGRHEGAIAGRVVDGRTADALAHRVAAAAGVPARVIPMAGGRLPLAPAAQSRLGSGRLGQDTTLGTSLGDRALGVAVELGPVASADAPRLRPGGSDHARVLRALTAGVPPGLAWRLGLLVATGDATPSALGGPEALGGSWRLMGTPAPIEGEPLAASG